MSDELIEKLRKFADESGASGNFAWGVAMLEAADAIASQIKNNRGGIGKVIHSLGLGVHLILADREIEPGSKIYESQINNDPLSIPDWTDAQCMEFKRVGMRNAIYKSRKTAPTNSEIRQGVRAAIAFRKEGEGNG